MGYHLLTKILLCNQTQAQINRIDSIQLERAAAEIKSTGKCTDPAILLLEHQVQVEAKKAPNSFAKCAEQAQHIKALIVSDSIPALWITLDPSDLQNTLVLTLAGVRFEHHHEDNATATFHNATATIILVAVAQFSCIGVFQHLLVSLKEPNNGLFGPVSTYFGIVETNSRGMLHLLCLVWLQGTFHVAELRHSIFIAAGLC